MAGIVLHGITWGHSRGITPLLAAAQRYSELYPEVEIRWKKRTLQEFADSPIEKLAGNYDLLIIDHPWVGCAAATNCVLPLNEWVDEIFLADQAHHSTGDSHRSYEYDGKQWAFAIDAATPAASYRKDLLSNVPQQWQDVIDLAKEGKVAVPAIPIDMLMNFYSFCIAMGEVPFQQEDEIVGREVGIAAIMTMKELYSRIDKAFFNCNPIAVAERMTRTNNYFYCPFAYGYSNYSRDGFAAHVLEYTNVVKVNGQRLRTTIGGTGIAVSATTPHLQHAVGFARMIASGNFQRTFYVQHGGQPGHRSAWTDPLANQLTNNYFTNVLPIMENGYLRPRYNGYLHFQDMAGDPLHHCMLYDRDPEAALDQMNRIYQISVKPLLTT